MTPTPTNSVDNSQTQDIPVVLIRNPLTNNLTSPWASPPVSINKLVGAQQTATDAAEHGSDFNVYADTEVNNSFRIQWRESTSSDTDYRCFLWHGLWTNLFGDSDPPRSIQPAVWFDAYRGLREEVITDPVEPWFGEPSRTVHSNVLLGEPSTHPTIYVLSQAPSKQGERRSHSATQSPRTCGDFSRIRQHGPVQDD